MTAATDLRPTLTPGDVRVRIDVMNREVITVPDDVARALARAARHGWREFRGLATGESARYAPDSWTFRTLATLAEAYAASEVPAGLSARDADQAARDRAHVSPWTYGGLYPMIVGRSGWDDSRRYWTDYEATRDLHVGPSPHVCSDAAGPYLIFVG